MGELGKGLKMTLRCAAAMLLACPGLSYAETVASAEEPRDSVAEPDSVAVAPTAADKVEDRMEKVGLVLSGGGAKGIAHVGVIKALEDADIPIDYVTGTSMGAIVGSLYSCGWSPERMLKFFTSKDFGYWSTGTIPKDEVYYYIQPLKTPQWAEININFDGSQKNRKAMMSQILPTSLISPLPMNIEFLNLYGPYSEQCKENFNNLFVPFRCVASDVYHKRKIVLADGSLGDAVRASMSFPLVYRPIKIDGVIAYDGGIYDNFPVNVMQEDFHPDFIIGVQVVKMDPAPQTGDLYTQVDNMVVQSNDYSLPADAGVKIKVPVTNYGTLQFDKAQEIYEVGYRTGLAMVDSIKSRLKARRPLEEVKEHRREFAAATPALRFDSISVTGTNANQENYLKFLFYGGHKRHTIDMPEVISAYYRAVTDGSLNNLVPNAEFGPNGHNTLLLQTSVKRPWTLGVGGWLASNTSSMLYVKAGFHTLSWNSLAVSLSGWVGQSYYAGMLSARFTFPSHTPSLVQLDGVMSRQKFYDSDVLFYKTNTPAFITGDVNYLRGSYIWAVTKKVKGTCSLAWGYMTDDYYPDSQGSYADRSRDMMQYRLGVLKYGMEKNTLNELMYPSEGVNWKVELTGTYELSRFRPEKKVIDNGKFKEQWTAGIELLWKQYFSLNKWISLGAMANGLATWDKPNQNYVATLIHSAAFGPTPTTKNYFNEAFRSNNYVALGVMPVWTPTKLIQVRGDFYAYSKFRNLENRGQEVTRYNGWFKKVRYIVEVAGVINFPFASLSVYCNYLSYPRKNWNFGVNFGLYFQAPKLVH